MHGLPSRFKVVRTDRELHMSEVDAALRAAGADLVLLSDGVSGELLAHEVADAELLLTCYAHIDATVIAAASRLKAIVKYGVGIDAIDIDAARARRIPVVNVPAYAERTVAEGAFALLMALLKRFKPIQQAMAADGWIWPEPHWLAHDLAGRTLGLIGCGHIGRYVARMASAFAMRVLVHDPYASALPEGAERTADLDGLLAASDAVSIHCVLNDETRHLLDARRLALMKRTAVLVNVSRGEIVDEAALLAALQSGRIAGAALDVYGREPLARAGHPLAPLYDMDNVIVWPHLTFYTHEAMRRLQDEALARCFEALRGEPLTVRSRDPRLRDQTHGVRFADDDGPGGPDKRTDPSAGGHRNVVPGGPPAAGSS